MLKNNFMKTLKNLVKTENLNIDELMLIKGALTDSTIGCGIQSCQTAGCFNVASSPTCTSAQCYTTIERDNPAR